MQKKLYLTDTEKAEKKNRWDLIAGIGFIGLSLLRIFWGPVFDDTAFFKMLNSLVPEKWGGATGFCAVLGVFLIVRSVYLMNKNRKKTG